MEHCLLCLESREIAHCIRVNSIQWQKDNIRNIIEKHLWPMDTTTQSSSLCFSCWQELFDFHRFYLRIEETHLKSCKMVNIGSEASEWKQLMEVKERLPQNNNTQADCKEMFCKSGLEPEIFLEEPLPTDFIMENQNVCINEDQNKQLSSNALKEEICKKDIIHKLLKNNKERFTEDPLNKKRKPTKKIKELANKSLKWLNVKGNKHLNKEDNFLKTRHSIESDAESENQSDSQSAERIKKKRRNPDERTGQEYDQFISDNFQIVCSLCHVFLENFITLRKHFRDEHNKRGFVVCCKKKIFSRPLLVDHIHIHLDPNYFKCQQCGKVYSERSTLESHIKIHDVNQEDRNHFCDKCGKNFVGITQLENHKRIHEPGYEKQFSCSECGKFFTTSYSLNYHIQAIHQNKFVNICDICGKTMRCRNQFKLHMEKHNSTESVSINCDVCGLRLTDRRGLRRHKNSQHPVGGKKEYSCHLCLKVSPNREALKTHIRLTHGTNYNHKCTMCDKAFKRSNALKEHMATHTGTALYKCPWCPKTFISNGNMHNHRKKAHPLEWEEAHRKKFAYNTLSGQK